MALFRRKETLNEKLMREAGMSSGDTAADEPAAAEEPAPPAPLDPIASLRRAFPGSLYPVPERARVWDAVVTATAPEIGGDEVRFWALPDGSIVVDEERGDAQLDPLADALEHHIEPPYCAHGVRESDRVWTVTADKIQVAQFRARGDDIQLTRTEGGDAVAVDGEPADATFPELEQIGEREGRAFYVRATRIDGDLWDVRAEAL
jgi:hypothetical protein